MKAVHSLSVGYVVGTSGCRQPLIDQIDDLERRRVRVHVMALKGSTPLVLDRPLTPWNGRSSADGHITRPWLARTVAWVVKQTARLDVLHLHGCASVRAAAVTSEAARVAGIGYSYELDGHREWARRPSAFGAYLRDARFVVVPWRQDAEALTHGNGHHPARIEVVSPGIDVRALTFENHRPEPTGRLLALIATTSRGAVRQLIDVLPAVDRDDRRVTVALAWPPGANGAGGRPIIARAAERRVARLPASAWSASRPMASEFDAVVWIDHATKDHGDPFLRHVLEAMAIGVPVVHVRSNGLDVVEHGRSGFVVPPGARDELVDALRTALWMDVVRRRIVRAARRRVDRSFNRHADCERLRRLFAASAGVQPVDATSSESPTP